MTLPSTSFDSIEYVPGSVFTILFTSEPTINLGYGIIKPGVFWAGLALSRSLAAFSYSCCCFLLKFLASSLDFCLALDSRFLNELVWSRVAAITLIDINLKLVRTLFMIYRWNGAWFRHTLQLYYFLNYLHLHLQF